MRISDWSSDVCSSDLFKEYKQVFPAVGLLGPRQVGKTTFVKGLAKIDDFIYLDLERMADREKLKDPGFYFSQYPEKSFILDEVQFMPEIFAELRGIIDADRRPGKDRKSTRLNSSH